MIKYSDRLSDDEVTIFLLHGVINEHIHSVRNYTRKHISSDFFYKFLKEISAIGTPLSMDEFIDHVTYSIKFPKKSFVITFDDGFENNYSIARPILQHFKIPATFYITTDFIERNRMSWIDRIEYVVELSKSGFIKVQSETWSFENEMISKRAFLDRVRKYYKSQTAINLDEIATDIQNQLGFDALWSSDDSLDKKMNWEQILQLNEDPFFAIGGHTHSHPILANLNDHDSEKEITKSLELMYERMGFRCRHFSYPEGLSNCYTNREITILKNNGIICCPSAIDGLNDLKSDLFHLKRVAVV